MNIDHADVAELNKWASERIIKAFQEKYAREDAKVPPRQEAAGNPRPANEAIRNLMIRKMDQRWQEHLLTMDHLRSDVKLAFFWSTRSPHGIQT